MTTCRTILDVGMGEIPFFQLTSTMDITAISVTTAISHGMN
jgi:hypothetical protein